MAMTLLPGTKVASCPVHFLRQNVFLGPFEHSLELILRLPYEIASSLFLAFGNCGKSYEGLFVPKTHLRSVRRVTAVKRTLFSEKGKIWEWNARTDFRLQNCKRVFLWLVIDFVPWCPNEWKIPFSKTCWRVPWADFRNSILNYTLNSLKVRVH